jgi:hypothetical protein
LSRELVVVRLQTRPMITAATAIVVARRSFIRMEVPFGNTADSQASPAGFASLRRPRFALVVEDASTNIDDAPLRSRRQFNRRTSDRSSSTPLVTPAIWSLRQSVTPAIGHSSDRSLRQLATAVLVVTPQIARGAAFAARE